MKAANQAPQFFSNQGSVENSISFMIGQATETEITLADTMMEVSS